MDMNRRELIKVGMTGGTGIIMLPSLGWAQRNKKEPHFMLQVTVEGGMDCSYLFDARPLAMTYEDKLIQNYISRTDDNRRAGIRWEGKNGGLALASDLVRPLLEYKDDLSIVNGVHMFPNFEGHGENMNFLLSGNPFGGDYFLPTLGAKRPERAIGYIQSGDIGFVNITNSGEGISLNPRSAMRLAKKLEDMPPLRVNGRFFRQASRGMAAAANGKGKFSAGAAKMLQGLQGSVALSKQLKSLEVDAGDDDGGKTTLEKTKESLSLITQMMKAGITSHGVLGLDLDSFVDTHDGEDAAEQEGIYSEVVEQYHAVIKTLKETPYDEERSFFDVTTIFFTTEFSRTMRQDDLEIDETGTDHNPLNNSFILAGKGIRGGMVVGESDFQSGSEELSRAHLERDPQRLKLMGRPFDFARHRVRADLPEKYLAADYINCNHVVNTLYSVFGVEKKHHRLVERNGGVASLLKDLIA